MAASFDGKGPARSIGSEKLGAQLEAYCSRPHALILRYLRNHADADDVMQTVNERVVKYLDDGGSIERLPHFMYRTAHNLAVDKLKERERNLLDYTSDKGEPDVPQEVWRNEPHEIVEAAEMLERLYADLPPRHQQVLEYRIAGMTCEEIAAVTGCTRTTVETYIKRLRSACRAAWKEE